MLTDQYLYCNQGTYANNSLTFNIPKLTNERVPNVGICLAQSTINLQKGFDYRTGVVVKLQNPCLNYISTDNKGSVIGFYLKGSADTTPAIDVDTYDLKQPAENITLIISPNQPQIVLTFEKTNGELITANQWVAGSFLFKYYYPNQGQIENQYVPQIAKVRL